MSNSTLSQQLLEFDWLIGSTLSQHSQLSYARCENWKIVALNSKSLNITADAGGHRCRQAQNQNTPSNKFNVKINLKKNGFSLILKQQIRFLTMAIDSAWNRIASKVEMATSKVISMAKVRPKQTQLSYAWWLKTVLNLVKIKAQRQIYTAWRILNSYSA